MLLRPQVISKNTPRVALLLILPLELLLPQPVHFSVRALQLALLEQQSLAVVLLLALHHVLENAQAPYRFKKSNGAALYSDSPYM